MAKIPYMREEKFTPHAEREDIKIRSFSHFCGIAKISYMRGVRQKRFHICQMNAQKPRKHPVFEAWLKSLI